MADIWKLASRNRETRGREGRSSGQGLSEAGRLRHSLRNQVVRSRMGRIAAMPFRVSLVTGRAMRIAEQSVSWLVHENETMNFSYELSPLNYEQLAWFISAVVDVEVSQVREWMAELESDHELREHIERGLRTNPDWRIGPSRASWGRRVGWYVLVRALSPDHVVETGTALGLGSCIIAAALIRNGSGHLTTIDSDPRAGHLIKGRWASVVEQHVGKSVDLVGGSGSVDLFIHDSLHTYDYELKELQAVTPMLSPFGMAISDNAHETPALSEWATSTGRRYLFFKEIPEDHWWPGDGIGVAWVPVRSVGNGR